MKMTKILSCGAFITATFFATDALAQLVDQDVPLKTQVIAQDLVVQGSACVGFDCVSSESFGFSTVKLKENNLRILFEDTSNSGSFPSTDWQLTANETSNGGLNKFSIDDITSGRTPFTIEASAPSHSLYVDDSGRVGMGTSAPVVEAHIKDGDSPTMRLEQDGSSGFTAQTWDLAGNEANFFVRDVTNGSKLPFKIKPGADDNALFIDANENIGLSTANPAQRLHVRTTTATTLARFEATGATMPAATPITTWDIGNDDGKFTFTDGINNSSVNITVPTANQVFTGFLASGVTNGNGRQYQLGINAGRFVLSDVDNSTLPIFIFPGNATATLSMRSNNVGVGTANPTAQRLVVNGDILANGNLINSDARLKRDITDLESAVDILSLLQPKRYHFRTGEFAEFDLPEEEQFGLLAQEVEEVLPNLVHDGLVTVDEEGNVTTQYKALNYTALVPVLVQGVKEQQGEIEDLKKENDELRAELDELKKLVYQMAGKTDGALNTQGATLDAATLAQNQPNPFSEATTIQYDIPENVRKAELRITDRSGKLIKTVVVPTRGQGQTVLEAGSLHAGQYYYTLVMDGQVSATKQMILTK